MNMIQVKACAPLADTAPTVSSEMRVQSRKKKMSKRRKLLRSFFFSATAAVVVWSMRSGETWMASMARVLPGGGAARVPVRCQTARSFSSCGTTGSVPRRHLALDRLANDRLDSVDGGCQGCSRPAGAARGGHDRRHRGTAADRR